MIYYDNAATTPLDSRVITKIIETLTDNPGNASSLHAIGKKAKATIEEARHHVANLIGASAPDIIWTSGATEANNLALKGAATLYQRRGRHIITLKTEHISVLDSCQFLEKQGFFVTYLSPLANGIIDLDELEAAFRSDTIIVSIMHINNETGIIQPIEKIAQLTNNKGVLLHVDAAQSAGKIPLNMQQIPIDLLSLSAHKLYGPKGVGALYLRQKPRVRVAAQLHGGGQEGGMRSGTLATHQIAGMGEAYRIAAQEITANYAHLLQLRTALLAALDSRISIKINGKLDQAFPGILNVRFMEKTAQEIIQQLPETAISLGSACHEAQQRYSHVLRAMGLSEREIIRSCRISFSKFNTLMEIERLTAQIETCFA